MSLMQFPSQLQNQPKIDKISADSLPFKIEKSDNTKIVLYQKKGHWTQKQKLKYSFFLTYFKEKFIIRTHRRNFKIFKVMADFVKTRSHNQCRSHHQKMEKQYNDLDTIITNVAQKYHPRAYKGFYQKYYPQIENLNQFYFSTEGKKRIKKAYSSNIQQQNSRSISQKQFNCLMVDQKAFKFFMTQKQNEPEKKKEGKTKQSYGQNQVENYEGQINKPFYFQLPAKLTEIQKQSIIINQNSCVSSAFEKMHSNAEFKDDYLEELQKNQIQKLVILQNYKMHSSLANYYQNEFWLCERKKANILQFLNNKNIEKNMRN